jgi:hypothetical protein
LLALTALGLIGCGTATPPVEEPVAAAPASTPGMNDPSWLTSREKLPPPDTDRIEYDSQKRTLTLYDLPGRDNWMVKLPDEAVGRLVGAHHRLPEGIDTTQILVYYARAGVKISAPVTVAQIEAVRKPHTSLDRMAFRD